MFTGIVKTTATVWGIKDHGGVRTLQVAIDNAYLSGIEIGASVALGGVCLTVVGIGPGQLTFDVIDTSLALTTLGELREGETINAERSFRVGDEIGGHIVSGHVSCMAEITSRESNGENVQMWFKLPEQLMKYVMTKGFIAVDGCSLTIVETSNDSFSVSFIPETLRATTFGDRQVGDMVNIEFESPTVSIVDTVERVLEERGAALLKGTAAGLLGCE